MITLDSNFPIWIFEGHGKYVVFKIRQIKHGIYVGLLVNTDPIDYKNSYLCSIEEIPNYPYKQYITLDSSLFHYGYPFGFFTLNNACTYFEEFLTFKIWPSYLPTEEEIKKANIGLSLFELLNATKCSKDGIEYYIDKVSTLTWGLIPKESSLKNQSVSYLYTPKELFDLGFNFYL